MHIFPRGDLESYCWVEYEIWWNRSTRSAKKIHWKLWSFYFFFSSRAMQLCNFLMGFPCNSHTQHRRRRWLRNSIVQLWNSRSFDAVCRMGKLWHRSSKKIKKRVKSSLVLECVSVVRLHELFSIREWRWIFTSCKCTIWYASEKLKVFNLMWTFFSTNDDDDDDDDISLLLFFLWFEFYSLKTKT